MQICSWFTLGRAWNLLRACSKFGSMFLWPFPPNEIADVVCRLQSVIRRSQRTGRSSVRTSTQTLSLTSNEVIETLPVVPVGRFYTALVQMLRLHASTVPELQSEPSDRAIA